MRVGQGHHHEPAGTTKLLPLLTVLVAVPLAGCTWIVDADAPQCEVDADCAARGAGFAGAVCERQRCVVRASAQLENLECKAPSSNGLPTVKYSFAIQLPTTGGVAAATSFLVQACQQ